jgi:hypothetical protein
MYKRDKIQQGDTKTAEEKALLYLQDIADFWGVTYSKLDYAMKKGKLNFNFVLGGNSFKKVLYDDIKNINYKSIFN